MPSFSGPEDTPVDYEVEMSDGESDGDKSLDLSAESGPDDTEDSDESEVSRRRTSLISKTTHRMTLGIPMIWSPMWTRRHPSLKKRRLCL